MKVAADRSSISSIRHYADTSAPKHFAAATTSVTRGTKVQYFGGSGSNKLRPSEQFETS